MAKLSAGQKRKQKELKRKKKKQLQFKKQQSHIIQVGNPSGLPKLSERLLEFADDILKSTNGSRHDIENTISIVVMCWNVGSVKAEQADEMRAKMSEALKCMKGEDFPKEFESELDALILKRRIVYSDDPRLIGEFQVNWQFGGDYSLQVLSMLLPEEDRFVPSIETISSGMSNHAKNKALMMEIPLTDQEEALEKLIDEGSDILNKGKRKDGISSSVAACEVWLEAWEIIKKLYTDETSIGAIENRLSVLLGFWSSDINMHLNNAAHSDSSFIDRGITFLQEFCDFFPDNHTTTLLNMRRTIAELHLMKGDIDQGEATFEALTNELPDETWGYIGWGDIYNPAATPNSNVPVDIERAKRLYRIPIVRELRHSEDAQERLDELLAYEQESRSLVTH